MQPEYTIEVNATGTLRLLEAVRDLCDRSGRQVRFYQAGTSEMFGSSAPPQSEITPFHPRSPYAVSKVAAYWQTVNHREAYGLFACNGILFNHESERRGETFVTRKITRAATRIKLGLQEHLYLGNLGARRDWGHAQDYVRAMWLMLQQDAPDDYVVATGESYAVSDFVERVFARLELDWQEHVRVDPRYFRPAEVEFLWGDPAKAQQRLNWHHHVSIDQQVERMVTSDLMLAQREKVLKEAGVLGSATGSAYMF